jgi:RNA polymerase sigma factor (sigma-70 family)
MINIEHKDGVEMNEANYFLDGIRTNNPIVIKEIYEMFSHRVIQLVSTNRGNSEQAKDVFQDVLVSLYSQLQTKKLELTCSFAYFFLLACKRRWLNVLNSKYIASTDNFEQNAQLVTTISTQVNQIFEEEERLELVRDKLNMMDPKCKEIIEMSWSQTHDGKYMNWEEVAAELGMSYGYIRKKAVECKQRLIEMVRKDKNFKQY